MNLCSSCGSDFGSVHAFDSHRVGKHTHTYLEGLDMSPSREDGRRCLDGGEMEDVGWARDQHGRWRTDAQGAHFRVRERAGRSSGRQTVPTATLKRS